MRGFRDCRHGRSASSLLVGAWLIALRRDWWQLLAASLFVVVVLGPSVQPWYFCWALAVVGRLRHQPAVDVLARRPHRSRWSS